MAFGFSNSGEGDDPCWRCVAPRTKSCRLSTVFTRVPASEFSSWGERRSLVAGMWHPDQFRRRSTSPTRVPASEFLYEGECRPLLALLVSVWHPRQVPPPIHCPYPCSCVRVFKLGERRPLLAGMWYTIPSPIYLHLLVSLYPRFYAGGMQTPV